MKKRLFAAVAAVAMVFSLGCHTLAVDQGCLNILLSPSVSEGIFERYSEEIADIEQEYGIEITGYTEEVSKVIKRAAVDAYNTEKFERRSQLATELATAKYEETHINPRTSVYLGYTVERSYGPIKGEVIEAIATGLTVARTVDGSVSIEIGDIIDDLTMSADASVTVETVAAGPEDGATLVNGKRATHRIITGILCGVIVKKEFVDVDPWTGTQMGDPYYEYAVIDEDGLIYSHLAQIGNPTYVENVVEDICIISSNYSAFQESLRTNPGLYI